MEKQRAKCWHNRSKFEQNTFISQVGLIYHPLCFATEHKRSIYSNKTVSLSGGWVKPGAGTGAGDA